MSEKPPRKKPAAWGKFTAQDRQEHGEFLMWFRLNFSPRVTLAIPGRGTRTGYTIQANNGARIGLSMGSTGGVDLFYHIPQGPFTMIDLDRSGHKSFREGRLNEEDWNYIRKHHHRLELKMLFWKANVPHLMEFLGCRSDLRFIAKLTLIFDYQIPNKPHETPVRHTEQPDLPSLELGP